MKHLLCATFASICLTVTCGELVRAQEMSLEWVAPITGSGGIILTTATALDQNENVYAVGAFRDSIEVGTNSGPVKLVSKGNEDMFIAKKSTRMAG